MPERMLDKKTQPTMEEIIKYIGKEGNSFLEKFEKALSDRYELGKELRFPYGKDYGWSYKYSHKTKHLCDLFFEKGAIVAFFQIGTDKVAKVKAEYDALLPKSKKLWDERYPCGKEGGWLIYQIESEEELSDVIKFMAIKQKSSKIV
ncbi:MAG: DUF3788 domain-containing protein [Oscillospiraceae bacterium]|nr:DUF3788 domain-containing protein [Oscillospiraceae bacterium]